MLRVQHDGKNYTGYTEEELKSLGIPISVIQAEKEKQALFDAQEARKKAYVEDSDPLFLEWQYDQTAEKEQAWRDKVAEIKARYPLPGEA
ncbi:hypothetical protein PB787_004609 [Vibrio parahaemolyticus]|nr:hypothetical protein [Vibrio parahaemolyticus]